MADEDKHSNKDKEEEKDKDEEKKEDKDEDKDEEKDKEKRKGGSRASSASSNSSKKSDKSDKSDKSHKKDKDREKSASSSKEQKLEKESVDEAPGDAGIKEPETTAAAGEAAYMTESKSEDLDPAEAAEMLLPPEPAVPAGEKPDPKETLSEEEKDKLQSLFEICANEDSSDGVKKLDRPGLKLLFRFMGEVINEDILTQWLKEEDRNVDGLLDWDEAFTLYCRRRQKEEERHQDLLMCLETLFPNSPGAPDEISLEKVCNLLKQMNSRPELAHERTTVLSDTDIENIIAKADVDGNKRISKKEFVNFLCSQD